MADIYGDDESVRENDRGFDIHGISYNPDDWDNLSTDLNAYEYDPEKQVTWATLLVSGSSLLLSGLLVGVCSIFISAPADSKQGALREFFAIYEKEAETGFFYTVVGPIRFLLFLGVVSLIFSTVTFFVFLGFRGIEKSSDYTRHPRKHLVLKIYTISILLLGILEGTLSIPLFTSTKALANSPLDGPDTELSNSPEQVMMDYENAIFNTCCQSKGWAEHDAIAECTYDLTTDCSFLTGDVASFKDLLCTCVENKNIYDKLVSSIVENGLCASLEKARVTVTREAELPGTTYSLGFIIELLYGADLFAGINEASIPVVGFHKADASNEDNQFGCGIGYAKGFMFIMQLFGEQSGSIQITLIAAASFGHVGLAIVCFLCYRVAGLENKDYDQAYIGMVSSGDSNLKSAATLPQQEGNKNGNSHYVSAADMSQIKAKSGQPKPERDSFRDSLLSSLSSHSERKLGGTSKGSMKHMRVPKRKKRYVIGEFVSDIKRPEFDQVNDVANLYHPLANEKPSDIAVAPSPRQLRERTVPIPAFNKKGKIQHKKKHHKKKIKENFLENFRRPSFDNFDGDNDINLDDF